MVYRNTHLISTEYRCIHPTPKRLIPVRQARYRSSLRPFVTIFNMARTATSQSRWLLACAGLRDHALSFPRCVAPQPHQFFREPRLSHAPMTKNLQHLHGQVGIGHCCLPLSASLFCSSCIRNASLADCAASVTIFATISAHRGAIQHHILPTGRSIKNISSTFCSL